MSAEQIRSTYSNRARVAAGIATLVMSAPYVFFGTENEQSTLQIGAAKAVAIEATDRFMDQTVGDEKNRNKLLKLSVGSKSREQIDRQFEVAPQYSGGQVANDPVDVEYVDTDEAHLRVRAVKTFDDSPAQPHESTLPYTYEVNVRKTNEGLRVESIEEREGWTEPSPTPAP